MQHRLRNRREAGRLLSAKLGAYAARSDVLVLGLPRGGVPVAYEVARVLGAPLDVLVVRKLGLPGHQELAMGAIASGGVKVLNPEIVEAFHIPSHIIDAITAHEQHELQRRERTYRDDRPPADMHGKTVILIDDGLATGMTMRAAVAVVRQQGPAELVVAVPAMALESYALFRASVDALFWLIAPEPFYAVGLCYDDFAPTTDAEVCALLACAAREHSLPGATTASRSSNASG